MKNTFFHKRNQNSDVRRVPLRTHRGGMTLIELLVVSAIMLILMAASIPVLTPMAENRATRETVRGVQSAFESARARAIRLGRPCGVTLMPFHENFPCACITMEQLTAPPSVVGSYSVSGTSATINTGSFPALKRGDTVQLNYTGPKFIMTGSSSTLNLNAGFDSNLQFNYNNYGKDSDDCVISYFPIPDSSNAFAKALGLETSFTLPKGYMIDLAFCGVSASSNDKGKDYFTFGNKLSTAHTQALRYPPTIVFRPDGTTALFVNGSEVNLASFEDAKIYILVGRWERMTSPDGGGTLAEDGYYNTQDPDAFWVVVNPKNGMISFAANNAFSGTSSNRISSDDLISARNNAYNLTLSKGGN